MEVERLTRDDALCSIEANVENRNLIYHMLATEAIMRAMARQFGQDEGVWGLTGLRHRTGRRTPDSASQRFSKCLAPRKVEEWGLQSVRGEIWIRISGCDVPLYGINTTERRENEYRLATGFS